MYTFAFENISLVRGNQNTRILKQMKEVNQKDWRTEREVDD